jgi:hypothetical protein
MREVESVDNRNSGAALALLQDIQTAAQTNVTDLGTIFLKLRLLAEHLRSQLLDDWIGY